MIISLNFIRNLGKAIRIPFIHSFQPASNIVGRLSITVAQAKLVRNYGLTRMDPYVRVRVGHFVFETQTDPNGGKTPHWNRVIHSQLPNGVNTIFVEIFDECSFKMDELIAWTEVKIPESVLRGETHEEWYSLSGKQGDHVEGMVDIVMSFTVRIKSEIQIENVLSIGNFNGIQLSVQFFKSLRQPWPPTTMQLCSR